MKLRTKTAIYFTLMVLLLFSAAGWWVYSDLQEVVLEETDEGLDMDWERIRPLLKQAEDPLALNIPNMDIQPAKQYDGSEELIFSDTLRSDEEEEEMEPYRMLTVITGFNGRSYRIHLYKSVIDADDMVESILNNLLLVFGIFIFGIIVFQFVISRMLWKPFDQILDEVEKYDLASGKKIRFGKTGTKEFRKMIAFLDKMTTKVQSDYQNLKKFTENASHEIQTPIAVIHTKLERLLQSEKLDESETELVAGALRSLSRLKKLNSGLLLLSKIENQQFAETEECDLSKVLQNEIHTQQELIDLKGLQLESEFQPGPVVKMHPVLAGILVTNLLSNAIKYSPENGRITIRTGPSGLEIGNTAAGGALDSEEIFQRFGKNGQTGDSPGLGLAIVKEICIQNGLRISYAFGSGMHVFRVIPD